MRLVHGSALAVALAILVPPAIGAQGQETARAVAGGGVSVQGWTGKIDANEEKSGQTLNNAKLAGDAKNLSVTTGPAVAYWNPANKASGNYTVKATFNEAEVHEPERSPAPVRHRHRRERLGDAESDLSLLRGVRQRQLHRARLWTGPVPGERPPR